MKAGFAVFFAPGVTETVDARFIEMEVHAGTRFRLAPLLEDPAILVASQEDARLYRTTAGALSR